jgi:hypothetical protein
MLKKIVTTVGLVSVFGASTAVADLDLSLATFVPLKVANETLGTGAFTTGSGANLGTTFLNIVKGANLDIDYSMDVGFNGATTGSSDYFIKVELTNAAFSVAAETMAITNPGSAKTNNIATSTLFSGGTVGSSSAIYQFDISDPITTTATITANLTSLGTNGNPSIKMSIFETLTEANAVGGSAVSTASKNIVTIAPGLKRTVTPAVEVAEVSADFKKFATATAGVTNLLGLMGSVTHNIVASTADASDGTTVTKADLYDPATSVATITGDLSNGTWWMAAATCANSATIAAGDKLKLNAAKTAGTTTGSIFDAKGSLCNVVDGVAAIPASAYTIGFDYAASTGIAKSAGAADVTGLSVGAISRNGTSQNINYLTTFASYNQRVFITNRGTVDATYAFTFQSEAGATATAGTAATGTSKAGSVLVLKAADIVTLTGKTRTAASLAIVGTPANFSIATQQVNLSNGATDTVIYKE